MAGPIRILLVEDNPGDARLLDALLREATSLNAVLEHVDRLEAARPRLASGAADVVLLDLSLPDAQGMSTVTRALDAAPDVPIIVLTGLDDETLAVQAVQAGAQDYLVKGQVEHGLLARSIRYAIERKQLERERLRLLQQEQEARSRAEAAVRARDQVLRVVSHDIGNHLSAIKINAAVLAKALPAGEESAGARGLARSIGDQVLELQRLREDLLDAASIEAGHLSIQPEPVQPTELIETARQQLQPLAAEKAVRVLVAARDGAPVFQADRKRLLQALGNLLGNAIKFTPAGGDVIIECGPVSGSVEISVSDTGPGIAEADLPRIFESFYKAGRHEAGAGLGLGIARGIVELHGGRIWAESEVGQGSRFVIQLPTGY